MTGNGVTAARRQELIASARAKVAKILVPDTTHIGAAVIAEDVLKDLDAALALSEPPEDGCGEAEHQGALWRDR